MNKRKLIWLLTFVSVVTAVVVSSLYDVSNAKVDTATKLKLRLKKPDIIDLAYVGYNNWSYVMRNNGSFMYDSPDQDGNGNNAGGEFPRGSGTTIVFAAGAWFGTMKNNREVVSECQFASEFQPGRIENSGVPFEELTAEDFLGTEREVYLIDRSGSGDDYNNWPSDAPVDQFGLPGLIADAQTWVVFNDLDTNRSQEGPADSPFPGLGIQITLESFAFNAGSLSNVVFLKFTFDNKTNSDYPNSYLGLWMDADVDNSSNDVIGSDSSKGLGYVYNVDNTDQPYATGFDFFQGPVVSASEVSSFLAFKNADNKTVLKYNPVQGRYVPTTLGGDSVWLGATTLNTYPNSGDPNNNLERYRLLQGIDRDGSVNPNSFNGWYYPGNPLTGIVNVHTVGNDQRILHGVGPFVVKAGAKQEVWAGVIAGIGTDRLSGVADMFKTDVLAQTTFNAGLVAPAPPLTPKINVTGLDGRVNITWSDNAELTYDNAGDVLGIKEDSGYTADYLANDFQGYRVYRSLTGLPGSYERLAQYDKADHITVIRNFTLNTRGSLDIQDINVGDDTGLRYFYVDENVTNLTTYYYSVTAYDAQPYIADEDVLFHDADLGVDIPNPTGLPISLETSPTSNVVSVVPMAATAGSSYDASVTASATHTGPSDGSVDLEVVDRAAVTGHNYRVEFFTIPDSVDGYDLIHPDQGDIAYRVYDITDGVYKKFSTRADNPDTYLDTNANGDKDATDLVWDDSYYATAQASAADATTEQFHVVDGILVKIFGPALDVKDFLTVANAAGPLNPPVYAAYAFNGSGFPSAQPGFDPVNGVLDRPTDDQQSTNNTKWGFNVGGAGTNFHYNDGTTTSFVARVFRGTNFSRFVPYDFELRFTAAGGQGNFFFSSGNQGAVPFEIWNVGIGTPDNSADDYRMYPRVLDEGGAVDVWDITEFDHPISGGDNDPYTDWIYWMRPTNTNPGQAGYDAVVTAGDGTTGINAEVMARVILVNWNGGSVSDPSYPANLVANRPETGTVFRIVSTKPNQTTDQFAFSTTANTALTSKSAKKNSLDKILVVPNPYYGRSTYQKTLFDKQVMLTNLPPVCTIKIFNVAGDLIATLNHNGASNNKRVNTSPLNLATEASSKTTGAEVWDLRNTNGEFVASGMYIAVVEASGYGKKMVKFAVIQEKTTINGPDIR